MKKIFCFGNEFVKEDSLAKQIANEIRIKGYKFIKCESFDDIEESSNSKKEIIIMDVVKGLKSAKLINGIDELDNIKDKRHLVSSHDFDLGSELMMRKAIGQLSKISIICLPPKGNKNKIMENVKKIILTL